MKHVKGSVFIPVIRGIKGDKSGIFDTIITDDAKEFIKNRIMSSAWYPFNMYKNCLNAVAKVVARGNNDILKKWGADYYDEILPTVYKQGIKGNELRNAMEMYKRYIKLIYDFGDVIVDYPTENEVIITFKNFDSDFEALFQIVSGLIEKFIESAVEKKVNSVFIKKSWEKDRETVLKVEL